MRKKDGDTSRAERDVVEETSLFRESSGCEFERIGSLILAPGVYFVREISNPHNQDYGPCIALEDPTLYFEGPIVQKGDVVFQNKWSIVFAPKYLVRLDCSTTSLAVSYIHS